MVIDRRWISAFACRMKQHDQAQSGSFSSVGFWDKDALHTAHRFRLGARGASSSSSRGGNMRNHRYHLRGILCTHPQAPRSTAGSSPVVVADQGTRPPGCPVLAVVHFGAVFIVPVPAFSQACAPGVKSGRYCP